MIIKKQYNKNKKLRIANIIMLVSLIALTIAGISACNSANDTAQELPILGNRETVEKQENGLMVTDTVYHTIADFEFIDQDSNMVTEDDYEGKVYVADFFFTSCPTICPIMKTQMLRVYEEFEDNDEVLILSHTLDPEYDSVALLHSFAERLGVESPKWRFVTGEKEEIYELGQRSYLVTAAEDKYEPGGFLHSGAFILVDKKKRIRGLYDGTKPDQVDKLIHDIEVLLNGKS